MDTNGILHLTVDADGKVSIYESHKAAVTGKQPGEVQVQLPLTSSQMSVVFRAQGVAKRIKEQSLAKASPEYRAYSEGRVGDPRD